MLQIAWGVYNMTGLLVSWHFNMTSTVVYSTFHFQENGCPQPVLGPSDVLLQGSSVGQYVLMGLPCGKGEKEFVAQVRFDSYLSTLCFCFICLFIYVYNNKTMIQWYQETMRSRIFSIRKEKCYIVWVILNILEISGHF